MAIVATSTWLAANPRGSPKRQRVDTAPSRTHRVVVSRANLAAPDKITLTHTNQIRQENVQTSINAQALAKTTGPIILKSIMNQNRRYKIISILRPTLSSDKAAQLVESMISLNKDEKIESQTMNMQVLAYPIDRNKQGHLSVTEVLAGPETIKKIRRNMEIDENILRVLFVLNEQAPVDPNEKHDQFTFQVKDDYVKLISNYTTKRGKIVFSKVLRRKDRSTIAQSIKRLRFLALLPYCNYDI